MSVHRRARSALTKVSWCLKVGRLAGLVVLLTLLLPTVPFAATRDSRWQVTEIYIATMGYAPDAEGLDYWASNIETQPQWTPTTVAQSFFDQPLVQAEYPRDQGYGPFIEALYQNIFGRSADSEGYAYWLGELESGRVQRNQMVIALIEGGWANPEAASDMARFGNRAQVGLAFTAEQAEHGIVYSQLSEDQQIALRQIGRDILATVTDDPDTREAAIETIPGLVDLLEPLPDLVVTSVSVPSLVDYFGDLLHPKVTVVNSGEQDADIFTVGYYLSENEILTPLDTRIRGCKFGSGLSANHHDVCDFSFDLDDVDDLPEGTLFFFAEADDGDDIDESNELNNISSSAKLRIQRQLNDEEFASNISASDGDYMDRIVVTWDAAADDSDIVAYDIYRTVENGLRLGGVQPIESVDSSQTSFTDNSSALLPGRRYFYYIGSDYGDSYTKSTVSDSGFVRPTVSLTKGDYQNTVWSSDLGNIFDFHVVSLDLRTDGTWTAHTTRTAVSSYKSDGTYLREGNVLWGTGVCVTDAGYERSAGFELTYSENEVFLVEHFKDCGGSGDNFSLTPD